VNLLVNTAHAAELKREAAGLRSIDLDQRQLSDLELLLNGGFSPLRGFMDYLDYESVLNEMRLADGTFWPIPVNLDVDGRMVAALVPEQRVALRDPEGLLLAILTVDDLWEVDKHLEADIVYGTASPTHKGIAYLMQRVGSHYIGGRLEGVCLPPHYDYSKLRLTPSALRERIAHLGWDRVVAFQPCYPLTSEHYERAYDTARACGANLLVHAVVGTARSDDLEHYQRVRSYQRLASTSPAGTAMVALLPLAMRMAGPRETLWHAIVQRNYGCTDLLVDADRTGASSAEYCLEYYRSSELQEIFAKYSEILGVDIRAIPVHRADDDVSISLRRAKEQTLGAAVPAPSMLLESVLVSPLPSPPSGAMLRVPTHNGRAQCRRGFTVFFTGLSGAGKSTLAKALMAKLLEIGERQVTLLDGDIVRKHLSSELGFGKEHCDINVRRIGYVASEITKHGGIAICAPIAPYQATRSYIRQLVEAAGGFLEVYVSTSLEVCESRDCKGLYAKARAGLIPDFTGIDAPYEIPDAPELVIDTSTLAVEEAVQQVLLALKRNALLDETPVGEPESLQ
jgi:sulfate adenylyltransferase